LFFILIALDLLGCVYGPY